MDFRNMTCMQAVRHRFLLIKGEVFFHQRRRLIGGGVACCRTCPILKSWLSAFPASKWLKFSDSLTISSAPPWKMTIRWPPSGNPLQCTRVKALPLTTYEYL
jgi:hypothetical protein